MRLYRESDPKPAVRRLAEQLNIHPEALRTWIRQDEADRGQRHDRPSTEMVGGEPPAAAGKREAQAGGEVLRASSAYFAGEIDPIRRRS